MKRVEQKNLTITPEQQDFLKANHGKITNSTLAKMLGMTYNKTYNNLKLMGLFKPREESKVIDMSAYFDIDKFGKFYTY